MFLKKTCDPAFRLSTDLHTTQYQLRLPLEKIAGMRQCEGASAGDLAWEFLKDTTMGKSYSAGPDEYQKHLKCICAGQLFSKAIFKPGGTFELVF